MFGNPSGEAPTFELAASSLIELVLEFYPMKPKSV